VSKQIQRTARNPNPESNNIVNSATIKSEYNTQSKSEVDSTLVESKCNLKSNYT
jgi:hypothetical protein